MKPNLAQDLGRLAEQIPVTSSFDLRVVAETESEKNYTANEVTIALATYNGVEYLNEQLTSIFDDQTVAPTRVLVADDGSSDGTLTLIQAWEKRYPDIFSIVCSDRVGSPVLNFNRAAKASTTPVVMFCDQDDIWHPFKIERALAGIAAAGGSRVCYFSDMEVVNESGELIAESFVKHQGLEPTNVRFKNAAVENCVSGNTMAVTSDLLDMALPFPSTVVNHDWWVAIVAAAFGTLYFDATPTLRYRQHASNVEGAKKWGFGRVLSEASSLINHRSRLNPKFDQLEAFATRFPGTPQAEMVEALLEARIQPQGRRQLQAIRSGIGHKHLVRQLGLLLLL